MKSKLVPEKIGIIDIQIPKASIDTPDGFEPESIKGYDTRIGFEMGFNTDEKLIVSELEVNIETKGNEQTVNIPIANTSFTIRFIFDIENFDELVKIPKRKGSSIKVDPNLPNAISSISYSTTRGILLTRLQGTIFSKFILPVADPNTLFDNE